MQTASDTTALHTASTARRDSIYLHDSVFVRIRADTVYLEKWHTRWRAGKKAAPKAEEAPAAEAPAAEAAAE